jgi:hypothetical protein
MKANEMHYFSHLFEKVLCMFRTCPLSIFRVSQHCMDVTGACHSSSVGFCYRGLDHASRRQQN